MEFWPSFVMFLSSSALSCWNTLYKPTCYVASNKTTVWSVWPWNAAVVLLPRYRLYSINWTERVKPEKTKFFLNALPQSHKILTFLMKMRSFIRLYSVHRLQSISVSLTSVSTRHSLTLNTKEYVKVLLCTKVPDIRNVPCFTSLSFRYGSKTNINLSYNWRAKFLPGVERTASPVSVKDVQWNNRLFVLGSILNTG